MHYSIPYVFRNRFPKVEYSLDGDDYSGLKWIKGDALPTLQEVEAADADLWKLNYILERLAAYNKEGATTHNLIVALWERVVENRPQASDDLEIIRQDIKNRYPKPPQ